MATLIEKPVRVFSYALLCDYKKFLTRIFSTVTFLLSHFAYGQELFPVSDLASSVPKSALGVRLFNEGFPESGLFRNTAGLKLLYGVTSKLSVYASGTVSNVHEKDLPFDFVTHNHGAGGFTGTTNTPQQGVPYPYIFNSLDLYAKYRFVTVDGQNTHFRMAAYGEGSYVAVPSHEAEPDLLVHTSGFGAGGIATYLKYHFAVSLTAGFIVPSTYKGNAYDAYGGVYPTTVEYGKAATYDLSFGYLLFPRKYTDYEQTNLNIYLEFNGRSYGAAKVSQRDGPSSTALRYDFPITTPLLQSGTYLDVYPGAQLILNSTYRVEFSMGFPLVNKSYNHLYPLYLFGVQRYFFFNQHKGGNQQGAK